VTLRLAGRLSDTRAASATTYIYYADSGWSETSVTWNNRPAIHATPERAIVISGTTTRWYEADLTDFIQGQRNVGRTTISIALVNPTESLPYVTFGSRESGNQPDLVITR